MTFAELAPSASDPPEPFTGRLGLAEAAYLARFKGSSREHTESGLRCDLSWCAERGLDPLPPTVGRAIVSPPWCHGHRQTPHTRPALDRDAGPGGQRILHRGQELHRL